MTKKLFWEDPYMKNCEAVVERLSGPDVVLDQTIFFPFSGGQASDRGIIEAIPVRDVVKSGDDIVHILEEIPEFEEGDRVHIQIDWDRRFRLMRLHSAAHIVYYLFSKKTGIKSLIGSNISPDKARLDFESPSPISDLLPGIEREANGLIAGNEKIRACPDRKDPDKRFWEMGDIKYPCGGTHLKSSGEIGKILLKRKNIGAGKERIEIMLA